MKNFHRWPLVGLTVAPIVLLAPIALGGVLYWGVPLLQFYPWQKLAAEMWRAGQLPLWNAWVGSGAPLAANLQTGAFYPLNFLYLILPTEHALGYTALLHVILAGWFMYAYLRALNLSRFAALIGALAFQLNGFLIARLGFLSIAVAFPWIAAWLWRVERLVVSRQWLVVSEQRVSEHLHLRRSAAPVPVSASQRINESETQRTPALAPKRSAGASVNNRKSTISNGLWLAVAIGLGVLAGHAQTAVYGLIFISVYFVWRIVSLRRCAIILSSRHLVTLAPRCGCSAGVLSLAFSFAVLIGLGLAAIQLLPAAELTRESQRASGLESIKVLTHSYWPPRLLTLLSPDFFGNPAQNNFWGYDNYWENAAYVGVLPLLLAVWSMGQSVNWSIGRLGKRSIGQSVNRLPVDQLPVDRSPVDQSPITNYPLPASFFTLATVLSLVLAFGWFTPIYVFLYEHVPGFDLFQGPARWLVVTIPALCVLAALGAQRWIERGFSRRAANRLILLGLALALAGLVALFILTGRVATFGPATLRLGGLLVIAGWLFKSRIRNQKSQMIVAVVVALDLIAVHFALNPVLPPDVYRAPNPAAEAIKADGLAGRVFYFDEDEAALKFGKYLAADKQFVGYGPNDLNYWL
ncbi:MAG TPA: hypothetical protein VFF59_13020, partial [Anaerolineae bacterium]|nr:hypothetical protein [Anaerolineae bacterium]